MNHEPSHLIDQCVRRVLVERGGSPLALEINASLARSRLTTPGELLIDAELELVIALASREPRDALAERVRDLAARWAERSPARAAALSHAATMLVSGVQPAPIAAAAPNVRAPAHIVDDVPVPRLTSHAPMIALAVLVLGVAAGGWWLWSGRKRDNSAQTVAAAAHPGYEVKRDFARPPEEKPAEAASAYDMKPAYTAVEPAPAAVEPPPPPDRATSVESITELQRLAIERGDWELFGPALADEVLFWGPDATDLMTGRASALAELKRRMPFDAAPTEPQLTTKASWGGLVADEIAWSLDDVSWTQARPGRKPSVSRFLTSRVAVRRGDRWEVVALVMARRTSDARLAAAVAAGVAPALAPITAYPAIDAPPVNAFLAALATNDAFAAFIAPIDGVGSLGSDAEKGEGTREVAKRHKKLGGRVYPTGAIRFELTASGNAAWMASNVELVSASKASGDVAMPYRMISVLVRDPSSDRWQAAMLHWSAGGPVPRVKGAPAASADDEADSPAADPSAMPAAAAPLSGEELRAAFGAVREAVEACRGIDGADSVSDEASPVRVLVKVVASVTAAGAVDSVEIEGDWAGTTHAGCVEEVIATMTFRAPGAAQTVRYPFAL